MRWRVAILLALAGITSVPAISEAVQPAQTGQLKVSVKPRSGAARTHFAVRFRAAVTTGRSFHSVYRVTASGSVRHGCQSAASAVAPPTRAGSIVRVVLAPGGSKRWCTGRFRGQVWEVLIESPCPTGKACPAIEPRPVLVGRFTFRVARG